MTTNDAELENELRRQAAAIRVETPNGINRRISAALAASAAESRPARARANWAWWVGAGGALAAALVGLFVVKGPGNQADTHADAAALAQEIQAIPTRVLASLQPQAAAAPQEDPLHQEASALAKSAHSALGFLAYNFLPVSSG